VKSKYKILKNEVRKSIYDLISKHPGLHLRELDRKTNQSFGSLRYHIKTLKKVGLIKEAYFGGFSRFYSAFDIGRSDKTLFNVFRQEMLSKIIVILILCENKKIFFKEDFEKLPNTENWVEPDRCSIRKHRTTLDFHLKKLVENKIIEPVKINNKIGYKVVNSEVLIDFLVRNKDSLSSEMIEDCLKWFDKNTPFHIDKTIELFWDIFPHPYIG